MADAEGTGPPAVPSRAERRRKRNAQPATVGQLKGVRRWLMVAGVWAVAATAIAVFSLVQADKEDEEGRAQAAGQLGRVQDDINGRIDALERQVQELPTSEDIGGIEDRLGGLEDDAGAASDRADTLSSRIDDLEQQVEDLEAEPPAADGDGDGAGGADETNP